MKIDLLVVVSHHIWPLTQISMKSACATSVSLFTFALLLLDTILTPWRGIIQKSIARMQAHFSLLDVGSAGKIIFLEFAPVSLLAGYRGVFLGFMVRVCHPVLQIMTLFQTTKLSFPHQYSDLASKIHTHFQTWCRQKWCYPYIVHVHVNRFQRHQRFLKIHFKFAYHYSFFLIHLELKQQN